jgi:hypothetical protein
MRLKICFELPFSDRAVKPQPWRRRRSTSMSSQKRVLKQSLRRRRLPEGSTADNMAATCTSPYTRHVPPEIYADCKGRNIDPLAKARILFVTGWRLLRPAQLEIRWRQGGKERAKQRFEKGKTRSIEIETALRTEERCENACDAAEEQMGIGRILNDIGSGRPVPGCAFGSNMTNPLCSLTCPTA